MWTTPAVQQKGNPTATGPAATSTDKSGDSIRLSAKTGLLCAVGFASVYLVSIF